MLLRYPAKRIRRLAIFYRYFERSIDSLRPVNPPFEDRISERSESIAYTPKFIVANT